MCDINMIHIKHQGFVPTLAYLNLNQVDRLSIRLATERFLYSLKCQNSLRRGGRAEGVCVCVCVWGGGRWETSVWVYGGVEPLHPSIPPSGCVYNGARGGRVSECVCLWQRETHTLARCVGAGGLCCVNLAGALK